MGHTMRGLYFNKRGKRMQIERIMREVEELEVQTNAKSNEQAGVHPCYAGTLEDVGMFLGQAKLDLKDALDLLS